MDNQDYYKNTMAIMIQMMATLYSYLFITYW